MGNTDLTSVYLQLEDLEQTKEVLIMKKQIREKLYQNLRMHTLEMTAIGRVIGYDELQVELQKAIQLLEIEKSSKK